MKIILKNKNKYILRFDPRDELIGSLKDFCIDQDIKSGVFSAIGACNELITSYYNLNKKEYEDKDILERLEIVSLTGSVALFEGNVLIHAHGLFSDSNMQVRGGHVKKLVVSATCELSLEVFDEALEREYDEKTGLNLLK